MRREVMRTLLYAALAVGCGGTIGGLWTEVPQATARQDYICGPGLNCGNIIFTTNGSSPCMNSVSCLDTNDGVTFAACITSNGQYCNATVGVLKKCNGRCQDST